MIRFLAMFLFVAVGLIFGILSYKLSDGRRASLPICLILGVMGAFAGMWLADIAEIRIVGNLIDSLLFASLGSTVVLGLNLLLRKSN